MSGLSNVSSIWKVDIRVKNVSSIWKVDIRVKQCK